ncbi:MAG TPA: hypothetical protein VN641_13105 [Urbifossiella sp.]|nr:hypothetical protein [Urbifossiella sp.]
MRFLFAIALSCSFAPRSPAAIVVLGNFTPEELTVTLTEAKQKPRKVTLGSAQVRPVTVSGPCDITFPAKPANATLRLDPYHAYVFLPDMKTERRLEGIAMPGEIPDRDLKPDAKPLPKEPAKIPVTLLVDDADPRADALWQKVVRTRFDEAAAVIAAHANIQLEFAGFDTWKSAPDTKDIGDLLADFATNVKVKPAALAIGYTSRIRVDPKEPQNLIPFGAVKAFPTRHILLRESGPRAEPEKVEAMIHHIGLALGATLVDPEADPGTVMRTKIANGVALHAAYRFRFDPLNVLAMNIWGEELRRGPLARVSDASPAAKARLARVYQALVKLHPGDANALAYLNDFDRDIAKAPVEPKKVEPDPVPKGDPEKVANQARDQVAQHVIRAIAAQAKDHAGSLTGDALAAAYVKAAAVAAWNENGLSANQNQRVSGFLIGIAIALDDTDALLNDTSTAEMVKGIESETERQERVRSLGNPTLRGRRDLCRRFAIGCGTGELLRTFQQAQEIAIERSFAKPALGRTTGISFPAIAAEFAGIEFARVVGDNNIHVRRLTGETTLEPFLPAMDGLREGLSQERFKDDFGNVADPRFQKVLGDIHARIEKSIKK